MVCISANPLENTDAKPLNVLLFCVGVVNVNVNDPTGRLQVQECVYAFNIPVYNNITPTVCVYVSTEGSQCCSVIWPLSNTQTGGWHVCWRS